MWITPVPFSCYCKKTTKNTYTCFLAFYTPCCGLVWIKNIQFPSSTLIQMIYSSIPVQCTGHKHQVVINDDKYYIYLNIILYSTCSFKLCGSPFDSRYLPKGISSHCEILKLHVKKSYQAERMVEVSLLCLLRCWVFA